MPRNSRNLHQQEQLGRATHNFWKLRVQSEKLQERLRRNQQEMDRARREMAEHISEDAVLMSTGDVLDLAPPRKPPAMTDGCRVRGPQIEFGVDIAHTVALSPGTGKSTILMSFQLLNWEFTRLKPKP